MRKPFIIAFQTERNLTDLQSLRRSRLIEKSKTYREYLKRLRRMADRRGDRGRLHPIKGKLMFRPSLLDDPVVCSLAEAYASLPPREGMPHEQMMLEIEVWQRTH
jgi:hypothetical protein